MTQVLFTSDLHLGHVYAAKARGYDNVHEHDIAVISSIEKMCSKRTLLWVLGDVAMRRDSLYMLGAIPGRMILVKGNHDEFPLADYLQFFEEIHGIIEYKDMWLSHCPIHPQEMYRCTANVHGHIHKNSYSPELSFPYINVNWDFHRGPISLDYIKELIVKGP